MPVDAQKASEKPPPPPIEATATAPGNTHMAAEKEEFYTVETDVYRVKFSNHGGVVRSWILKNYKDSSGHPLELVNEMAGSKTHFPFSLAFKGQNPSADVNQALWVPKPATDGIGVDYEFASGKTSARKSFRFERSSYLVKAVTEVFENNTALHHLIAWRGGFGDETVFNAATVHHTLH